MMIFDKYIRPSIREPAALASEYALQHGVVLAGRKSQQSFYCPSLLR